MIKFLWSCSPGRGPAQPPIYRVDLAKSVCKSHKYDHSRKRYVFTVEQGTRFFLKLKLTADPMPSTVELYKNHELVASTSYGTIYVSADRICIQTVYGQGYAGVYKLSCNNGAEGHISFQLKVKGTCQIPQCKFCIKYVHTYALHMQTFLGMLNVMNQI